jgi:hypothetical protein
MGTGTSNAQSCGYCPLDTYWGGVETGAYRFDSSVPTHVQQATFWADDGWGAHFHDQNDSSGTLIAVANHPDSGVLGWYDANNNELYVDEDLVNSCVAACDRMISTISHEFGHSLGIDHNGPGCESSIMSWDRNRDVVIGPSDEDMCWYMGLGGSGEPCDGDDSPKGCVPYDRIKKKKGDGSDLVSAGVAHGRTAMNSEGPFHLRSLS